MYPRNGELKLAVIQLVNPELPGNKELSSPVIRASGIHQTNGNKENPTSAQNGPPSAIDDSEPNGPPLTEKKIRATNPHKDTGRVDGITLEAKPPPRGR